MGSTRVQGCQSGFATKPSEHPDAGPRSDDEGDEQRPKHRSASPDGDRPHVGTHQTAHEGHGQHGGDHRECCQDRRISHLTHRLDGDGIPRAVSILGEVKVPDDVLDHHDGVIDQNTDAEDQREKGDSIEREPVQVEDQQRQGQRRRDGHRHDPGFPPSQSQPDEQRHADHGKAHVQEELVGFFGSRLAVVAGDRDRHIRWNQNPLQGFDFSQDFFSNRDRIGPRSLADSQRDGGLFTSRTQRG